MVDKAHRQGQTSGEFDVGAKRQHERRNQKFAAHHVN
jgi:hypothetical protein